VTDGLSRFGHASEHGAARCSENRNERCINPLDEQDLELRAVRNPAPTGRHVDRRSRTLSWLTWFMNDQPVQLRGQSRSLPVVSDV
jgi:hypothetical protein